MSFSLYDVVEISFLKPLSFFLIFVCRVFEFAVFFSA